jgi:predicted RND superfamily exporter protein
VAWLDRSRNAIFVLSVVVSLLAADLASRLTLRSDLSNLLPASMPSVKDLEVLRHRARSFGNVMIMLDAPTPEVRVVAATELEAHLRTLDERLIAVVSTDDNVAARYGWTHRFLFVDLDDLVAAKTALADRLRRARLDANPLFIDLDAADLEPTADSSQLDDLQARLVTAERAATSPGSRLSPDGRSQLITLAVTFPSSDIGKGRTVMTAVRQIGAALEARHAGVRVEFAGSINISIYEHDSVINGMALAAAITVLLVVLALLLYYRALLPVLCALWATMVGVLFTLGFTYLAIGHLNLLSAFLTAIVVGNGINPGLIVLARYGDEIRAGAEPRAALAPALFGSLHGTLAASLTAAVAYGSLIVTDFRGFRHFGIIGVVGMIACWLAAYTVLPVTLTWLARRRIRMRRPPAIGELLERLAPRRTGVVLAFGAAITVVAIVITTVFLVEDPFQKDWRDLQSDGAEIRAQREVDARMNERFTKTSELKGHSYKLAIAVSQRDQVRAAVARLRALEAARPKGQELFVDIKSIDDLVPPDQEAKLVVLAEIRTLFDDPAIAQLDEDERSRLLQLRPPDDVRPITERDVPDELLRLFVEQDGSVGRLIYVKGAPRFQTWNVDDRVAFAAEVRKLQLPEGVVIGGEPLVIADIVASMEHDAPLMIVVALAGSILAVWLVIGLRRHGAITLVCGFAGVVVMIAACAVAGLRVHFLDLIALPITIGIGIDYAVNLVSRDREDPDGGARNLLRTTGAAVLLCSFTTTVGYGSLILSSNGGVRAFGTAAILGELSCIVMALVLAPALLARSRHRT